MAPRHTLNLKVKSSDLVNSAGTVRLQITHDFYACVYLTTYPRNKIRDKPPELKSLLALRFLLICFGFNI